jgi:hypothetical protein
MFLTVVSKRLTHPSKPFTPVSKQITGASEEITGVSERITCASEPITGGSEGILHLMKLKKILPQISLINAEKKLSAKICGYSIPCVGHAPRG